MNTYYLNIKQNGFIRFSTLLIFCLITSVSIFSQEICDDGIDNDGDGLIDCADPDCKDQVGCEGTFSCESALYQVLSGQLNIFDPATLSYTPIGPNNIDYNGTGYNIQDGYIYGQVNDEGSRYLWKIFNDGTYEVMGEVIDGTDFPHYKADFDNAGNLMTYQSGILYYIDVDQPAPYTYTTASLTNLTNNSWPSANDITYDYIYDKFYLMTSGRELWMIDENNGTIEQLADFDTEFSTASGGFGAAWSDGFGNLYFFNNSSGNIYKVEMDATGDNVVSAGFLVAGTPNGSNDGMSCPLATIPEICGNGLDDDGDGLTDCDDPDCNEYVDCVFTESSGGNNSGLESNDRLAEKIAKRNFNRTQKSTTNLNVKTSERRIREEEFVLGRTEDAPSIVNFIPVDPLVNSATYMSTPDDLIGITNAIDVYSVDYFVNQGRVGSILALESENGVYEHVKYICDRLHGTEIETVLNYAIDGVNPFIITKYNHTDGLVEYACNFSFYQDEIGNYKIESHWNLSDYPTNSQYFTFQVWANNMFNLEQMVLEVLNLIEVESNIASYNFTQAPNLFVRDFSYDAHVLTLNVVNRAGSESLEIVGSSLDTETGNTEEVTYNIPLNGQEYQTVTISTDGIYAMGLSIYHPNQTVPDGIYFADGPWGLDYAETGATVNNFTVSQNSINENAEGYTLERSVNLEGTVSDYIAVYRSLNAAFNPMNMSEFTSLIFTASGSADLEITIIKDGIQDWGEQMRTTVSLEDTDTDYQLNINDFSSTIGANSWEDVKMIVFKIVGNQTSDMAFDLEIKNLEFGMAGQYSSNNEMENASLDKVFPNPMTEYTTFQINAQENIGMTLKLINTSGQVIVEMNENLTVGRNEFVVENKSYPVGIYFYEIMLDNGERKSGKLTINAK